MQLALDLQPLRTPMRQRPVIERLRAALKRQGIDWRYRALKGSVLLRPMFGPHMGWQPMCGRFICGAINFERLDGYRESAPLSGAEREELQAYLAQRREAINALWGKP